MARNHRDFLELRGELVYLQKLDREDIDQYWEAFASSSVESKIFTGTQMVFSKSDLEGYVESIASDRNRMDFLIFARETGQLVGEVVLNDISRFNRSGNIRVAIFHQQNFSKGFGTEAMILALDFGFGMFGLHRIDLSVLSFNERGLHVYQKLGFRQEGVLRDAVYFDHQYHDLVMMSILEDEFREKYRTQESSLRKFL